MLFIIEHVRKHLLRGIEFLLGYMIDIWNIYWNDKIVFNSKKKRWNKVRNGFVKDDIFCE